MKLSSVILLLVFVVCAFNPESNRTTEQKGTPIKLSNDADNVRYDTADKKIYVGFGDGALGIIDVATNRHISDILLKGHPESFQLEQNGPRIFVNVPAARHIAVVDRSKGSVVAV